MGPIEAQYRKEAIERRARLFPPPPPPTVTPIARLMLEAHKVIECVETALKRGEEIALLQSMPAQHKGQPPVEAITRAVCAYFSVTATDLKSVRRTHRVVRPRQIAMYLAKTLTGRSLPDIGRRFGDRDHTTVLSAVRKIAGLVETDSAIANAVNVLTEELRAAYPEPAESP